MNTRNITAIIIAVFLVAPVFAADDEKGGRPEKPADALKQQVDKFRISATLEKTFERLEELSGLKIAPDWPAVENTGVERDTKVVLRTGRVTVAQLLDLVAAQVSKRGKPLAWYVDGRVVKFTTQMRVLHRDSPRPAAGRSGGKQSAEPSAMEQIEFDQTPLRDVIAFIRNSSKVNIHVYWNSLETVGVGKQTPVTVDVSGVSVGRLLTLVTDYVSADRAKYDRVYWVVNEGVVEISTGSALDKKFKSRVYDVSDLLMVVPDFKAPSMDLSEITKSADTSGGGDGESIFTEEPDQDEDAARTRAERGEQLIKSIKESIGEDMWQPTGRGSIKLMDDRLIITQSLLGFKLLDQAIGTP